MALIANIVVSVVALLHVYFLVLEMFLWDRPTGLRAFGQTLEAAKASKVLAANQGLYNGFLAAGLVWERSIFPFLWCWQLYGGRTGYPYYGRAYTLALEPFTSPILPLTQCIEEGQAPVLRGGHTLASRLEAGIFEVASGIKRLDFDGSITVPSPQSFQVAICTSGAPLFKARSNVIANVWPPSSGICP